jgi:hypothetical protein
MGDGCYHRRAGETGRPKKETRATPQTAVCHNARQRPMRQPLRYRQLESSTHVQARGVLSFAIQEYIPVGQIVNWRIAEIMCIAKP